MTHSTRDAAADVTRPTDARQPCPRCGKRAGRLASTSTDDAIYCGCCGLVMPSLALVPTHA